MAAKSSSTNSTKKTKKKKSIFRSEFLLLVVVLLAGVGIYLTCFLDLHLRYILQKTLTKTYGAEVNVAEVDLDLFKTRLTIKNIDFTNHEKPMENLLSIGQIALHLNPKDLMFFSITSDTSYLEGLMVNTPRKYRGYVSPEAQRLISYSTDLKGGKEKAIDQKFEGSIFENLYNFSKSKDLDQELKNIQEELDLKNLENQYKNVLEGKKQKLKNLSQSFDEKEYKSLIAEVKAIDEMPSNSKEWASALATSQKLISEIKSSREQLKQLKSEVKAELSEAQDLSKQLRQDVDQKFKQLQNKFKLPDISAASISSEFFGHLFQTRFYLIQNWVAQLRQNSEQAVSERLGSSTTGFLKEQLEKAREEKAQSDPDFESTYRTRLKEQITATGQYIHFGKEQVRPKLWIKKLEIDSKSKAHQDLQNFKGHILNIANNQKTIGKPLEVLLTGDLPKQRIEDINIDIKLNHHLKEMGESFNVAARYPISSFKIFNDSSFKLFLEEAAVYGRLKGAISELKLSDFGFFNQFKNADFFFETSKSDIQKVLKPIFADLPEFNVDVLFSGSFLDPDMLINSSLAQEISQGLRTQFSAELSKAQGQLQTIAEDSLQSLQGKYITPYLGDLNLLEQDAQSMEKLLNDQVKKLETKLESKKDEKLDELKDKAKDALKKLKF